MAPLFLSLSLVSAGFRSRDQWALVLSVVTMVTSSTAECSEQLADHGPVALA